MPGPIHLLSKYRDMDLTDHHRACAEMLDELLPDAPRKVHQVGDGESYFVVKVSVSQYDRAKELTECIKDK